MQIKIDGRTGKAEPKLTKTEHRWLKLAHQVSRTLANNQVEGWQAVADALDRVRPAEVQSDD